MKNASAFANMQVRLCQGVLLFAVVVDEMAVIVSDGGLSSLLNGIAVALPASLWQTHTGFCSWQTVFSTILSFLFSPAYFLPARSLLLLRFPGFPPLLPLRGVESWPRAFLALGIVHAGDTGASRRKGLGGSEFQISFYQPGSIPLSPAELLTVISCIRRLYISSPQPSLLVWFWIFWKEKKNQYLSIHSYIQTRAPGCLLISPSSIQFLLHRLVGIH